MRRDRALVAAMCSVLRRVVFVKGEVLAREGEVVREMFFLEAGRVKQEREADDDARDDLGDGFARGRERACSD